MDSVPKKLAFALNQSKYGSSFLITPKNGQTTGTGEQKEIDWIEEADGLLAAYEFKWNARAKTKSPGLFLKSYPGSDFKVINPSNIEEFLL